MTRTSFQDDFDREVERQAREAIPTCTYWRGIRIEDLSKDELIAALHQACSMLSEKDKIIEGIHVRMFDRWRRTT